MPESKTKPRFNLIDAIILLAVIAVVAGVGYKVLYKPVQAANAKAVNVTITVRFRNISKELAEAFVRDLPSDCISGTNVVEGSVVKSATIQQATWLATNSEGVLVEQPDPYRVDVIAIVEGTALDSDTVYMVGNQEVRIGRGFWVKTVSLEFSGTIMEMTVTSADKE